MLFSFFDRCFALILIILAISSGSKADGPADDRFTVKSPRAGIFESVAGLTYSVQCSDTREDQVWGYLDFQNRRVIVNLYRYKNQLEVSLGTAPVEPEEVILHLEPSESCSVRKMDLKVNYEDVGLTGKESSEELPRKLALIYSPFINYRENQYDSKPNDTPLLLAYSVGEGSPGTGQQFASKNKVIRYTAFFSDEDTQFDTARVNAQLARYGRTTDIEWVYEIELSPSLEVVDERFQGALHWWYRFRGSYLPSPFGRAHPILYNYNLDNNNVVMDSPFSWSALPFYSNPRQQAALMGHHLVPRYRIDHPHARERLQFQEPWMLQVSEAELERQGHPAGRQLDQLFVRVLGRLKSGWFQGVLSSIAGGTYTSGGYPCFSWRCDVDQLGSGAGDEESYTAVSMGENLLDALESGIEHGDFRLNGSKSLDFNLEDLRFFRLKNFGTKLSVADISDRFHCLYRGKNTVCLF